MENQNSELRTEQTGSPANTSNGAVHLTKHHGLGNDFLIAVDPPRPLAATEAISWCDRRTGLGADGLIIATPLEAISAHGRDGGGDGDGAIRRWQMVLWNADGSRAEISGNGIRCLGQAIAEQQNLDPTTDQELTIDTDAGTRPLTIKAAAPSDADAGSQEADVTAMVRVGMGKAVDGPAPSTRWDEVSVPVSAQRGVDVGNPHLVGFVDDLGDADMAVIGPVIEADYPAGVNVHLVSVVDDTNLQLRVWERGAGVTQACGSGAVAAAWAANAAGLAGEHITVDMPGGSASVELGPDEIYLIGPAVRVAEVIIGG